MVDDWFPVKTPRPFSEYFEINLNARYGLPDLAALDEYNCNFARRCQHQ